MTNDLQVLDPPSVRVTIAGRDFEQKPLGLRGTAALLDVLATTVTESGSFSLFSELGDIDLADPTKVDVDKVLPVLLQTVRLIPDALPKLIAIALRTDDVEFIGEHVTPVRAMRIIKTFISQNDIPQLVRDFTEVAALFRQEMATLAQPPTENGTGSDA